MHDEDRAKRRRRLLFLTPFILPLFVGFVALGGWVVMLLWNWLLPPLFGWHTLTFWQALGLLALCRILFGGFGLNPRPRGDWPAWRWSRLTPEERERFRARIREHWGGSGPEPGTP